MNILKSYETLQMIDAERIISIGYWLFWSLIIIIKCLLKRACINIFIFGIMFYMHYTVLVCCQ